MKRLTKSRIIRGLQCEKSLYLATHHPGLASKVTTSQQMIFDQGHEVGIEAQRRHPGGVLIDAPHTDSDLALMQTSQAIQAGANTIYEATLEHQGVLVKVDILHRKSAEAAWELIEVKSSTGLKEVYLEDVAIQKWVLEGAGIKTQKAWLMHINNECRVLRSLIFQN